MPREKQKLTPQEQLEKKRQQARQGQRKWYAENRSGAGPGRPSLVPKEVRTSPVWTRMYACLYARLKSAIEKLPAIDRPTGKLRLSEALAPYVKSGTVGAPPDLLMVEDRGGNVWEYNNAEVILRCVTSAASAIKKIKRNSRRGETS